MNHPPQPPPNWGRQRGNPQPPQGPNMPPRPGSGSTPMSSPDFGSQQPVGQPTQAPYGSHPQYRQQLPGGFQQHPGATPPQKPRRTGLIAGLVVGGVLLVAGAIVGSMLFFGGHDHEGNTEADSKSTTTESQPSEIQDGYGGSDPYGGPNDPRLSNDPGAGGGGGGYGGDYGGDVLAEREAFFEEQGLPLDGTPLKAHTPEQKAFIEDLKQLQESLGNEWDDGLEWTALALSMDACETSILNSHRVDANTVRIHASTSPIVADLAEGRTEEERIRVTDGAMSIATRGVGYLCPADYDDWKSAMDEIDGDF